MADVSKCFADHGDDRLIISTAISVVKHAGANLMILEIFA
jgi:hypothetical protein